MTKQKEATQTVSLFFQLKELEIMCDKLNYEITYESLPPELAEDHEGYDTPGIRAILDANPATRYDTTPTEVLARLNGLVPLGTATEVLRAYVERGYSLFDDDDLDESAEIHTIEVPVTVGELALTEFAAGSPPQVA